MYTLYLCISMQAAQTGLVVLTSVQPGQAKTFSPHLDNPVAQISQ